MRTIQREGGEPMVILSDGSEVYQAVYETVVDLLDRGHQITVSDEGVVRVDPPAWENAMHVLTGPWHDVARVLDELALPVTVH